MSAQVSNPISSNRCDVTLPTPGILFKDKVLINSLTSFGLITNCPLGLFISEAILARNFKGATPAEAVKCNSSKIAWRISCAIQVAEPEHFWQCVTSK